MTRLHFSTARPALVLLLALAALLLLAAGAARADTPSRFEASKTPKGLTFYYRHVATTPFAAINFALRDVYALTTPGKEGFSALGASLVLQGADGAGQTEFMERMQDLAASASVSLGSFATTGGVRAPSATIAPAMSMLASTLKTAAPSERLLARLKQRATGSEAQSALRAETIADRTAQWVALGDHPMTRGLDPARFERIGTGDLALWRKAVLGRDRIRLAVSGRIEKAEAARLIDEAFADLPDFGTPSPIDWPAISLEGGTVVVEHDTQQSAVLLVGLTSIGPPSEVETALLANSILGASNGRLWQGVRATLGSTYGASSSLQLVGPGKRMLTIRAAVANDQVGQSVEALRSAYARWRQEGVTAAELKATAGRMINDYRAALDDPARANALVVNLLLASRPVDDLYTYDSRVGGLSRDALNRFITDKFPPPEGLLVVIVTPSATGLGATCILKLGEPPVRCRKP